MPLPPPPLPPNRGNNQGYQQPNYQQQPYQQNIIIEQPKKKNPVVKIIVGLAAGIGFLVLAIIAIGVILGLNSGDQHESATIVDSDFEQQTETIDRGEDETVTTEPEVTTATLGETIKRNDISITVSDYEIVEPEYDDGSGDVYLNFYVTMTNDSGSSIDYNSSFFELNNPNGEIFSDWITSDVDSQPFGSGSLMAGKNHSGAVTFKIDPLKGDYELYVYESYEAEFSHDPAAIYEFSLN